MSKLFTSKKPHFEFLRKKWIARENESSQNLVDKHLRQVALGSLGGLMLLTTPNISIANHRLLSQDLGTKGGIDIETSQNALLASELIDKLPSEDRKLSTQEEDKITQLIEKDLHIKEKSEIDGKRLNRPF